jgi:putative endonuclease
MKLDNRTEKRKLGDIGENIACNYLTNHGFEVVDRNYLRKWGELDIVARKKGIIHFIEVKSVSCATPVPNGTFGRVTLPSDVIRVTDQYRPEENVHPQKLKRLARAIQTYILEKRLDNTEWQLDIVTVKIDQTNRRARVEMLENIII